MKIQVLPPDVNESRANFTPVGNDIRFGLTAVRNVGANVVDGIVAARDEKGRYADFNDFMDKVPVLVCNKRVIESLVKAGAFDEMKHKRRALVAIHETAVDQYVDIKKNEAIGQDSLFGGLDEAGRRLRRHRRDPRHRRVGQDDPARPRARHARPLRLRPPAARPRARALQTGTDCTIGQLMLDEERAARLDADDQRPGHLGPAQDHQARRRLGDDHPRGPRRRDRGAAVPERLPAGLAPPGRGRDHPGQGPALPRQGPARAARPGGQRPRPLRRPVRPGRRSACPRPGAPARWSTAQGGAGHAPRRDRGPAPAACASKTTCMQGSTTGSG